MNWPEDICRICGEINENCVNIYNNNTKFHGIEEKIKKCLKLQLCENDYKPKQICNCCLVKLDDFDGFMNICCVADQKFESMLLKQQWSNNNENLDHTETKMSVIVTSKTTSDPLYVDLKTNCPINQQVLSIVENVNNFAANLSFYQQEPAHSSVLPHPDYRREIKQKNTNATTTTGIKSENCDNSDFVNFSKTVTHFMAQPIDENQTELQPPPPQQQNKKSFKCTHCEKVFKRRLNLTAHIRTFHSKIRPYKCDKCSKSYAIRSDLTNHRKIHTEHFKCQYCSSCFIAPSKLERHIRTHTNYRPYKCDYQNCQKSFSDKRNLDDHKITHTNFFNYSCSICWKAFKTKNVLRQHERTHNRQEKFVCDICKKAYSHKQNLELHLKKHNGYICQYCKIDCERLSIFLKHKRTCMEKHKLIDDRIVIDPTTTIDNNT